MAPGKAVTLNYEYLDVISRLFYSLISLNYLLSEENRVELFLIDLTSGAGSRASAEQFVGS